MTIKVIIAGPRGRMGKEAVNMVANSDDFQLVACIDTKNDGKKLHEVLPYPELDVPIFINPEECFHTVAADVFVDLTVPESGYFHTRLALMFNLRPVIGTTGFTAEQLDELQKLSKEKDLGGVIAPNFALGAVLMMQFSRQAAKYFPDVEIIEMHHDQKLDAPSGTAEKTVALIQETRTSKKQGHPNEKETIAGARGAEKDGIRIHSVRLPGLVAHQEVIFGGPGQTLTLRHDSLNRDSFMSGIHFAIKQVMEMKALVYGLENLMELNV
ncbi:MULTISPECIES: 4-hydroxy-tetrahydrodipicolinate reductase [unclassified Virgibacillus]|uniref:4-hydroxy-tetrahydrodipicolinate reductase n=1 Tax=unclassified Virgibacillus TaxID=2620237 RepID=UPI0024DE8546|nr:4-hydroxy-tetrahydrodipicolinate reductase [Virgibacillus sp. LDC-1]